MEEAVNYQKQQWIIEPLGFHAAPRQMCVCVWGGTSIRSVPVSPCVERDVDTLWVCVWDLPLRHRPRDLCSSVFGGKKK